MCCFLCIFSSGSVWCGFRLGLQCSRRLGSNPVLDRTSILFIKSEFHCERFALLRNSSILLAKLNFYGPEGKELNWFKSYLENRRQYCKVNGKVSKIEVVNCGVPQGSCLGPLLFLVYINDLPNCLEKSNVSM